QLLRRSTPGVDELPGKAGFASANRKRMSNAGSERFAIHDDFAADWQAHQTRWLVKRRLQASALERLSYVIERLAFVLAAGKSNPLGDLPGVRHHPVGQNLIDPVRRCRCCQ